MLGLQLWQYNKKGVHSKQHQKILCFYTIFNNHIFYCVRVRCFMVFAFQKFYILFIIDKHVDNVKIFEHPRHTIANFNIFINARSYTFWSRTHNQRYTRPCRLGVVFLLTSRCLSVRLCRKKVLLNKCFGMQKKSLPHSRYPVFLQHLKKNHTRP